MTILKHLLSLIAGFFSCVILVMLFLAARESLFNSRTYADKLFDSVKWKDSKDSNERLQMIKDLEYYYISRGMSAQELISILSKPDLTKGDSVLGFGIGSPGILASKQTLTFKIDSKGTVKDFVIE